MGLGGLGQDVWPTSPKLNCAVSQTPRLIGPVHSHVGKVGRVTCAGLGSSKGAWVAQQGDGEQEGHRRDLSAISSHDSYLPSGVRLFCVAASFPISPWDMVLCSLAWPSPEVNRCTVCNDSKHEAFKNKTALGVSDDFFFPYQKSAISSPTSLFQFAYR